jgi:glycosyltransferase involved in cell wall biosynthesis
MISSNGKAIKVSLLIPTLNEEKNLPHVLPRIPLLPEIIEVILIDGSSTDNTVKVARELMPQIRVVLEPGIGKGEAINCGARAARGDYFLILDADGSHLPEEIPLYIRKAEEGYDLVKGSRYLGGTRTEDETLDHGLLVRISQFVANTLWRTSFTDICYGLFLIDRQKYLDLKIQAQRHDVEWELMAKAVWAGLKIVEVPAFEARRIHGKSHLSLVRDGWLIANAVFREGLRRNRTRTT